MENTFIAVAPSSPARRERSNSTIGGARLTSYIQKQPLDTTTSVDDGSGNPFSTEEDSTDGSNPLALQKVTKLEESSSSSLNLEENSSESERHKKKKSLGTMTQSHSNPDIPSADLLSASGGAEPKKKNKFNTLFKKKKKPEAAATLEAADMQPSVSVEEDDSGASSESAGWKTTSPRQHARSVSSSVVGESQKMKLVETKPAIMSGSSSKIVVSPRRQTVAGTPSAALQAVRASYSPRLGDKLAAGTESSPRIRSISGSHRGSAVAPAPKPPVLKYHSKEEILATLTDAIVPKVPAEHEQLKKGDTHSPWVDAEKVALRTRVHQALQASKEEEKKESSSTDTSSARPLASPSSTRIMIQENLYNRNGPPTIAIEMNGNNRQHQGMILPFSPDDAKIDMLPMTRSQNTINMAKAMMDSMNDDETDEPSILSTVLEQTRQKQIASRETEQKVKTNAVPLDVLQNVESFFDRMDAKREKENHTAEHYDEEFDEELNGIMQYMADDLPIQSFMMQDTLKLPLHVPLLEHISEIEEISSSSEEEEEEEIVPPKLPISATRSRSNSNVPPLTNLSARIAASTQKVEEEEEEDLLNTPIATIVNTNAIDSNIHNRDEDETLGNTTAPPPVVDFNSSLFPKIIFGKVRNSHANNSVSLLPPTSENSVSRPLSSEAAKTKKLQKSLKSAQRQQFTEQTRHMDMTIKTLMEQQLQLFTHTLKSELNKKNEGLLKLARIVDKEHKTLLTIQETLSTQKTFIGEQERWQQQLLNILKHMTENFIAVTSNITNSNATAAANTQSYRTLETNYDSIRKMLNIMVVTLQTMSEAVTKYQVELNVVQRVANQQQVDHHSMLRMVEDRSSNTIDTQQKTITVLEENKKSLQTKNKGLKRQVETLQNELIRTQFINKSVMGYLEQQNLSIKFEYVDTVPDSHDETRIVPSSSSSSTKKSNSSSRKH